MPELAEVEYFRKRWDVGIGDRILAVQLHAEKRIFRGTDVSALGRRLTSQRLLRSEARGKQMLFVFAGDNWLGIHLGMSGKLRVEPPDFRAEKHDHLVLRQKKRTLAFSDARQFGRVRFHYGRDMPGWWAAGVPEINSHQFTKTKMKQFVRRHGRAPIKAVLLLQKGFPGIGNWMADEILWRAQITPRRQGGKTERKTNSRRSGATPVSSPVRRSGRLVGTIPIRRRAGFSMRVGRRAENAPVTARPCAAL